MVLTVDTNSESSELTTTVNVKEGFGDNLYNIVSDMLKSKGRIPLAEDSVTDQINQQQDKIDKEQTRLDKHEQSLKDKFARMEALLSQIQRQMASITSMT